MKSCNDCEFYHDEYGGVCFAQKDAPRVESLTIAKTCSDFTYKDAKILLDPISLSKEQAVFLNTFSMNEYINLLQAILEHTISDLSIISGISKEELLDDYIYMHDYDPVREIRKKNGMYDEKKEMKSSALIVYERRNNDGN